jgi:hypothetical protein
LLVRSFVRSFVPLQGLLRASASRGGLAGERAQRVDRARQFAAALIERFNLPLEERDRFLDRARQCTPPFFRFAVNFA